MATSESNSPSSHAWPQPGPRQVGASPEVVCCRGDRALCSTVSVGRALVRTTISASQGRPAALGSTVVAVYELRSMSRGSVTWSRRLGGGISGIDVLMPGVMRAQMPTRRPLPLPPPPPPLRARHHRAHSTTSASGTSARSAMPRAGHGHGGHQKTSAPAERFWQKQYNTVFPWYECAEVTPNAELHAQVAHFTGTTALLGSLFLSITGTLLASDPPDFKKAGQRWFGGAGVKSTGNAPDGAVTTQRDETGGAWTSWSRHDAYYMLISASFCGALSITMSSVILLGNLQAIPVAVATQFVQYNALRLVVPGFLIPPTCLAACSALVIAAEEEIGERAITFVWRAEAVLTAALLWMNQAMMQHNHKLRLGLKHAKR